MQQGAGSGMMQMDYARSLRAALALDAIAA
jgi:hypothetical protein